MLINNFLNPVYEDFLLHFSFDGIEALVSVTVYIFN